MSLVDLGKGFQQQMVVDIWSGYEGKDVGSGIFFSSFSGCNQLGPSCYVINFIMKLSEIVQEC